MWPYIIKRRFLCSGTCLHVLSSGRQHAHAFSAPPSWPDAKHIWSKYRGRSSSRRGSCYPRSHRPRQVLRRGKRFGYSFSCCGRYYQGSGYFSLSAYSTLLPKKSCPNSNSFFSSYRRRYGGHPSNYFFVDLAHALSGRPARTTAVERSRPYHDEFLLPPHDGDSHPRHAC
ncbi:hypothetical protein FIBSPDRAFT_945650 [Athelia psychrophila]|uniref:Uncharacterized protein n=1 Tax=Athelia psychrophila TaxID=1759441 RepID=A0A166TKK9_9AGAM|nr:hypothetical protein FIBSPDRAFT_945650 [Fibularhizoctonia sp. CBS 109695]